MAGLQRSAVSFRRQGSSGAVWDDRLLSGELKKLTNNVDNDHHPTDQNQDLQSGTKSAVGSASAAIAVPKTSSTGNHRTGKVSPAIDPPSPKLSACGFCGVFGKTEDKSQRRKKPANRRAR